MALFDRLAEAGLTSKHAGAKQVRVNRDLKPEWLHLAVHDDGLYADRVPQNAAGVGDEGLIPPSVENAVNESLDRLPERSEQRSPQAHRHA